MTNFAFSFSIKKKETRPKQIKVSRYSILERNAICVCDFYKSRGFFVINLDGTKIFPFTNESFKIKKGKKYSTQLLDDNKRFLCIIDNKFIDKEYIDITYIPFMAGVICKGDIVKDTFDENKIKFDLKDTFTNWTLELAYNIASNYVKNYQDNLEFIEQWKMEHITLQKKIKLP